MGHFLRTLSPFLHVNNHRPWMAHQAALSRQHYWHDTPLMPQCFLGTLFGLSLKCSRGNGKHYCAESYIESWFKHDKIKTWHKAFICAGNNMTAVHILLQVCNHHMQFCGPSYMEAFSSWQFKQPWCNIFLPRVLVGPKNILPSVRLGHKTGRESFGKDSSHYWYIFVAKPPCLKICGWTDQLKKKSSWSYQKHKISAVLHFFKPSDFQKEIHIEEKKSRKILHHGGC